jgi:predicted ferric reductase
MKSKTLFGWIGLMIICFTPAALLLMLRPAPPADTTFANVTHIIGQLCALIGTTMFALTFVLSTRWKWIEEIFDGLDKVYRVHAVLGGNALILLLFHPIFLVMKFIPERFDLASKYIIPGGYISVDLGIYALLTMILLLVFTFYSNMKYHIWKISHKFLGIVYIAAVFHIFMVASDVARDYIFAGYYIYAGVVGFIGISAFLYALLIKSSPLREAEYIIESVKTKDAGVFDLTFIPKGTPIRYRSGQFIFIRFLNDSLSREAHPFSVASPSNSPSIRVMIKGLGDFTSKLTVLKAGNKFKIEGPYGRFSFPRFKNSYEVWIAGGIGITPFLGMAQDLKENSKENYKRKVDLYYSVVNANEYVEIEDLRMVESTSNGIFRLIPWLSSEKGFLSAESIEKISNGLKNKVFYLCGPADMKNAIKEGLIKKGIPKERIIEEDFAFR